MTKQPPEQQKSTLLTLSEVGPTGSCLVASAADGSPEVQSRLYALGLFPGSEVTVLRVAPAGDPMQVRVGSSTLISIRRAEAALIEVEQRVVES